MLRVEGVVAHCHEHDTNLDAIRRFESTSAPSKTRIQPCSRENVGIESPNFAKIELFFEPPASIAQVPGLCVPPTFLTEESCKAPAILPAQARPLNGREFSSSVWYLRLEVWAHTGQGDSRDR